MVFDPDRETAILDATLELLTEVGYDRMSIDQIARRASASKATIYRRWSGKAQLVADLVVRRMHPDHTPIPDAGSLRDDLVAWCQEYGRAFQRKQTLFLGLLPVFLSDQELAHTLREHVPGPDLDQISRILDRARDRGELNGKVEARGLLSILEATVWHRVLLTGEPLDPSFFENSVDRVLLPLLHAWTPSTPRNKHRL